MYNGTLVAVYADCIETPCKLSINIPVHPYPEFLD